MRIRAMSLAALAPLALAACEPESPPPSEVAAIEAELSETASELEGRLGRLTTELDEVARATGAGMGAAADSLRVEAGQIRAGIDSLTTHVDTRSDVVVMRIEARLDSLQRDLVLMRFRAADEVETFERTAESALSELRAEMARLESRLEEAGPSLAPELRDRWAGLQGEITELEAEVETISDATAREGEEAFTEAREAFARTVAEAARELRRIAAEIEPDAGA